MMRDFRTKEFDDDWSDFRRWTLKMKPGRRNNTTKVNGKKRKKKKKKKKRRCD
jgi:hypothetical protein